MLKTIPLGFALVFLSFALFGCSLQKDDELPSPVSPASSLPLQITATSIPSPQLEKDESGQADGGLSPVDGDEIDEGEEVVE